MRRCKSIDELYEEVKEFDLVITNDAPLATALNARIDFAKIGHFALTPKQIATIVSSRVIGTDLYSELKVLSTISDETDMDIKYVHSELDNIKEIRTYTSDVRKYLFTRSSKKVYDSYEPLPTLERVMSLFIPDDDPFYKGESVAVIGAEFFNDLDKHFIPLDYEPIDIFTDDDYSIERIYEIGNDRQLAENAVDLIDLDRVSDYAFVLNTSGPLTDALRSALYRKQVPFINSLKVRDLSQIRDYLRFITLSMNFETLRVKHVRDIFSNYNGQFRKGREEFLLCRQNDSDMTDRAYELWQTMRDIRKLTFGQVCDILCNKRTRIQVNNLIDELDVRDRMIDSDILSNVQYAVDNVNELKHNEEIPENERKGVLIADCNNSIFIDRPIVIFLGMEQDWNRPVAGKRYIDAEDETDRNVMKLNALLQQGDVRFYLVNNSKGGRPARPSTLFDLLYGCQTDSFSSLCNELVSGRWHKERKSTMPEREPIPDIDVSAFKTPFSKSSFNAYFGCPRRFMYHRMLSTPDKKSSEFGTLIHSFAEFYVCYPEDVHELGLDHFVSLISDKYSGLSSPMMSELDSDKIRKAMESVIRYIDHLGIEDVPLDLPIDLKKNPNRFMVAMGKEYTSSLCERRIDSSTHPVYGNLDLTWDGVISDYKTGSPKKIDKIADDMNPDVVSDYPEFQAPIYLTLMKEDDRTKGRFDLFFTMDNDTSEDAPITDNVRSVVLYNGSLKDAIVTNPEIRDNLRINFSAKLRDHADDILDTIKEMGSDDPSEWSTDEGLIVNILDVCGMKDNKTNRGAVIPGLKKVAKFSRKSLVPINNTVVITEGTLDSIMGTVDDMYELMNEQSLEYFPPKPRKSCDKCEYRSVCTKDVVSARGDDDE